MSFMVLLQRPTTARLHSLTVHRPLFSAFSYNLPPPPSAPSDYDTDSDSDSPLPPPHPSSPALLDLISAARSQSPSQHEALALLRSTTPHISPSAALACRALWELRGDWEAALIAFRWARECVVDCPRAWYLVIWSLGKQGRFDVAWAVLRRMHRKEVLTSRAMIIMIQRYAAANEVNKAIRSFYAMEKFKLYVDNKAFYALLHALCKNKNVEEAEELLLKNRKFFPLETEGFNVILDGWCNIIGDLAEAKRVWREMSTCCITPDGTSYAHLICCFSKVGNLFHCLRLYDEMKKKGWIPNLVIYNSLVYVLTRENCLKDAHNIFNRILEAGLNPNLETYNSMIHPLCEAHNLEEAWELMNEMTQKGIHPTVETYHAFAKAEDIGGTLILLRRMRDTFCGPTRYTFLLIFDKFFKLHKTESALRMWTEMSRYLIPAPSHYIILVQGLVAHGWIPKALQIYNEMKSKGYSSDPKLDKLFKTFLPRK